jgi:isopentenyl diphosphate isomerase/L-lactate dehydrogenase-like FMN-dependent dehydrogenase
MTPSSPINTADLERLAAEALEPGPHGYFAGGAGDERTLRANVEAFSRWELRPRVLVDVSEVSTRAEVLGREASMPILVAPTAFQAMAHSDGELGMARAAAAAGTVMCVSTFATVGPAEVAAAAPGGRRWLQLYWLRDFEIVKGILAEARESGYEAIVLTVDAPYAGRRERDLRNEFAIPAELGVPALEAALGSQDLTIDEVLALVDPSVTWSDLERLASEAELPLFIKGVMTAEDGRLAVEHGAAGVVVSNHGGRQLDGVAATLEALPEVAEAVDGRIDVLMDGGIRRGTDVAVALALGAEAVLVGRPILWGLTVDGQAGAELALGMLRDELELALALLGCASPAELSAAHLRRAG